MIFVFGGISIDFIFTKEKFLPGTSNPSNFTYRIGGVGFNIFNNLNINEKIFITTIGDDFFGHYILDKFKQMKLDCIVIENKKDLETKIEKIEKTNLPTALFFLTKKYSTAIYNVLMQAGSCYIATADFSIIENNLSFENLKSILNLLEEKDICVLDANLLPSEIEKINNFISKKNCKTFFETISYEKAKRAKEVIENIFFTSPDNIEYNAMVEGYESIFNYMNSKKIEYILKTEGGNGSFLYSLKDKTTRHFKPKKVLNLKDTTGAGDFLFSKIIEYTYHNYDIEKSIIKAMDDVLDYLIKINEKI